jgi:hypothetical protein
MPEDFDPNALPQGVDPTETAASEDDTPSLWTRMDELAARAGIVNGSSAPMRGPEAILLQNIFRPYPCYQEWNRQQIAAYAIQPGDMRQPVRMTDQDGEEYNEETGEVQPDEFVQLSRLIDDMIAAGQAHFRQIAALDFSDALRNYQPKTEIILTQDKTIMRVIESRLMNEENGTFGAPHDMVSLYSWPGGTGFYQAHPEKMDEFVHLITTPRKITLAYAPTQIASHRGDTPEM